MIGWKNKRVWKEYRRKMRRQRYNLNITNAFHIKFPMGITLVLIKCNYKSSMNFTTKLIKDISL
jgi:hypothetical protein